MTGGVVAVLEVVDLRRVAGDRGVRSVRRADERGPIGPAADQPGRRVLLGAAELRRRGGGKGSEPGHVLGQLAEHEVGAVAAQRFARRGRQAAVAVGIAEDELADPKGTWTTTARPARPIGAIVANPGDGGLPEAVGEPEVLAHPGELRAALLADRGQPGIARKAGTERAGRVVEVRRRRRVVGHEDVRVAGPEPGFPARGGTRPVVAEDGGASRHAGTERGWEGGQQRRRQLQGLEPGVGDGDVHAEVRLAAPRLRDRDLGHELAEPAAGRDWIVDPDEGVRRHREVVGAQDVALDVVELDAALAGHHRAPKPAITARRSAAGASPWVAVASSISLARAARPRRTSSRAASAEVARHMLLLSWCERT